MLYPDLFTVKYPEGFESGHVKLETTKIRHVSQEWSKKLDYAVYKALLEASEFMPIFNRATNMLRQSNILNIHEVFELDTLRYHEILPEYLTNLFDYLYATKSLTQRFADFIKIYDKYHNAEHGIETWEFSTCFAFLANPKESILIKFQPLMIAAENMYYHLPISSRISLENFIAIQEFIQFIKKDIAHLNPLDNIDILFYLDFIAYG